MRVNDGMGPDAILGKAKRKLSHRIWELLQGSSIEDVEDTIERDGEVVETTATTVETVAEPVAQSVPKADRVASGDLRAADPTKAAFQSYIDALEKTDMVRVAEGLYLSTFGPDGPVAWTPEQGPR